MTSESCWPPKRRRLVEMGADGVCNVVSPIAGLQPISSTATQSFIRPFSDDSPKNATPVAAPRLRISPYQNRSVADSQKLRQATSSLEMEGEMVDQALDNVVNLPDAVNEVVLMHKDQSTEIQRQQLLLHTLKERLKEGQKRYERTLQDIAQITRRIYLTEDQVLEKKRICESHEASLTGLLSKVEETKAMLERDEVEKKISWEKLNEYRNKMEAHEKCTCEYEKDFPVQKKLREMEAQVAKLKSLKEGIESNQAKAEQISSGKAVLELKQQQESLKKECQVVMNRIAKHKSEITEQQSKQIQIKQSIEVLHKRNAAQLTRLKRQLKEVQSHNRQWQDQAVQLEQSVAQARRQLEE